MKAMLGLWISVLLLSAVGCTGEEPSGRAMMDGAVVEEEIMPESVEERSYAARSDPDRGDHARAQMERTDEAIRQSADPKNRMKPRNSGQMQYTRPVLRESVMRDGFTGAVIH